MKLLLTLASVLLLAFSLQAFGVETEASPLASNLESSAPLDSATHLTADPFALPSFMLAVQTSYFTPACSTIEGTSCTTSGGPLVRCYNYQYCEPMVCVCQSGIYNCF